MDSSMCLNLPAIVALTALLLPACDGNGSGHAYELTGTTMGTRFSVKIAEPLSAEQRDRLAREVDEAIARVDESMSTYLVGSDISKFNASRSTDWVTVSKTVCAAVAATIELSELTGGAFDSTVGPLVNLWGFGPETVELAPPPAQEIATAQDRVGYQRLHTDCSRPALKKDRPDVYIDLSAYAKGFAVDQVAELLDDRNIDNYVVELGGELRMSGRNADGELWAIAIEKPTDTGSSVQMVLRLTDVAVSTSGDYRNFFVYEGQRYSHLIDARTGRPVSHNLASVTIIADQAAFADAMATALLVLGPSEGMQLAEAEDIAAYFQIRDNGGFVEAMSPAFRAIAAGQRP